MRPAARQSDQGRVAERRSRGTCTHKYHPSSRPRRARDRSKRDDACGGAGKSCSVLFKCVAKVILFKSVFLNKM